MTIEWLEPSFCSYPQPPPPPLQVVHLAKPSDHVPYFCLSGVATGEGARLRLFILKAAEVFTKKKLYLCL